MNNLTVTISGPAKAGKSSLASVLSRRLLSTYGVDSTIEDDAPTLNHVYAEGNLREMNTVRIIVAQTAKQAGR